MKFEIKHRWSGEVLFSVEADSFKVAVEAAIKSRADLSEANLSRANLSRADLSRADLSRANLSRANLSEADLSEANLSEANLSEADLSEANLSEANLSEANLSRADLRVIKHDFWGVLLQARPEVDFLRKALIDGKVDGSTYSGTCACLCGTIAHGKGMKDGSQLPYASASSPAERFFLAIREGDTPEANQCAKLALEWLDEFVTLTSN